MEMTLIAAKILGLYLVVSGLFLLLRGKTVPHLLKDFFGHPAIMYLAGVILIFLSALFLMEHNIWDGTWRTLVTVFAWAVFLKGLGYIFFPEALHQMVTKKILGMTGVYGIVSVAAGVALYYLV